MRTIVIVEAVSTGVLYEQDIIARGYQPLVIYPYIGGKEEDRQIYEGMRNAAKKLLSKDTVIIYDDGDFDRLLHVLESYDIACVVAGSEMGVVLADRLADALSLPGNPPASSMLHLDKDQMQEALRKNGLRSIRGKVVYSVAEALDSWEELQSAHVVLKPVSGAGTVGLHFCDSKEELRIAAEEEFSKPDLFGKKNGLILQERIEGTEYIVNTVSRAGVHRVTDIWVYDKIRLGKYGNAYNYARILRRLEAGHGEMVEYAYGVLDALDIKYGPGHGEIMLTENGPVLIEVGARPMGGSFSKELLDKTLGHHLTDVSLDAYLDGEAFEAARHSAYEPKGFLLNKFFINPEASKIESFPVISVLRSLKTFAGGSLAAAFQTDILPKTVDLETAPGNILLYSEDENEVWRDYQNVRNIEERSYETLFHQENGKNAGRQEELPDPELAGLSGRIYILADEKRELAGAEWLTVEELAGIMEKADAGIWMMGEKYSLEERMDSLREFIRTIKPGGIIEIPEQVYENHPVGRTGLELALRVFGIVLDTPVYGETRRIRGIVEE